MKLKNEQGVTLVELLVVIVLVSMVASLIMTTFFIVNRYNLTETRKLKLQQDANYIVTTILQKHRMVNEADEADEWYILKINDVGNLVYSDSKSTEIIIGEDHEYEMTKIKKENISRHEKLSEEELYVQPKKENVTAKLIVTHPKNKKLSVSIDTTFKRYKTEN